MILLLYGPKGPSAWQFGVSKQHQRIATCLNDLTVITVADDTRQATVAALQALVAHTVVLSGAPTVTALIPW